MNRIQRPKDRMTFLAVLAVGAGVAFFPALFTSFIVAARSVFPWVIIFIFFWLIMTIIAAVLLVGYKAHKAIKRAAR